MLRTDFIGNLGQDAEKRITNNGREMITFSVAVSKSYKNKDGVKVSETTWLNCTMFKDSGDSILPYLKKGQQVFCSGEPSSNAWIDSKSGEARSSINVIVNSLNLLGSKKEDESEGKIN